MTRPPGPDRTFVKICGLTRVGDARFAVSAGANAVGFIFARSRRRVSAARAAAITQRLHPAVSRIGVFVDATSDRVLEVVEQVGLDGVQLQGSETPSFLEDLKRKRPSLLVYKVVRPMSAEDVAGADSYRADAIFFDLRDPSRPLDPVSPIPLDWLQGVSVERFVVAGGLTPSNVAEVVSRVCPWGVDVSGGVESEAGRKDRSKVRAFIQAVRTAEAGSSAH